MKTEQERADFEAWFPVPDNCQWCGDGYAPTEFNAWEAKSYADKFEGWMARSAMQSQDMRTVIEALETAQNNECGPRRPWGSADPDSDEYAQDAFMWDYYQRAIGHARRIEENK